MSLTQKPTIDSRATSSVDPGLVLVVGSSSHAAGVFNVSWSDFVQSGLSVADYELVVLNLSALTPEGKSGVNKVLTKDRIRRLLQGPRSELVMVGHDPSNLSLIAGTSLPSSLSILPENGSNLTDRADEFGQYLDHVESYSYIVSPIDDSKVQIHWSPLIKAASRDTVGIAMAWVDQDMSQPSGRAIWLPETDTINAEAAIDLLLTRCYGVGIPPKAQPTWLGSFTLPSVERLQSEAGQLEQDLDPLLTRRSKLRASIETESAYLEVLYETGNRLEVVVWTILEELGATVQEPADSSREDGRLTTPIDIDLVLEIKGRIGKIGLGDVRQLDQWVTDAIYPDDDQEPESWEGLLIANSECDTDPQKRGEPLASNAGDLLRKRGLHIVSTVDLVDALTQSQRDEFDAEAWWLSVLRPTRSGEG